MLALVSPKLRSVYRKKTGMCLNPPKQLSSRFFSAPPPVPPHLPEDIAILQKKIETGKFVSQIALESNPGFSALPLSAQYMFEYLHYVGLPWWGAILAGSALVRIVVFPFQVKALQMAGHNAPHFARYNEQLKQYAEDVQAAQGDQEQLKLLAQAQVQKNLEFYKEHNPFKQMLPAFLQIPIYISVFLGLQEMCSTNPTFQALLREGGCAWFTDLTVRDPYLLIPLACAASSYLLMRGLIQTQQAQATVSPVFLLMARVMPPLSFVFSAIFPAGLSIYFFGTGVCALVSTRLLQNRSVKKLLGIPIPPERAPPPQPPLDVWGHHLSSLGLHHSVMLGPPKQTDTETIFKEKE